MSEIAQPARPSMNVVPGLVEYYASQANLVLSQYKNINLLLGDTSDWQHPGELCEVLLRDFLRRFLPSSLSVDKGFIYGRTTVDGSERHCPELDILIHDTQRFSPLFRMGDFAIVQPEAVRGFIQVKRTLNPEQLSKGMKNVVHAKQHWVNLVRASHKRVFNQGNQRSYLFSAVVGYEENGLSGGLYRQRLRHWHENSKAFDRPGEPIAFFVLPEFIGSLTGSFVMNDWRDLWGTAEDRQYSMYPSSNGVNNVALQAMLHILTEFVLGLDDRPPFDFPSEMHTNERFMVLDQASS